jgi:hypothetical protein
MPASVQHAFSLAHRAACPIDRRQVDPPRQVHFPGVDLQDVDMRGFGRVGELDLWVKRGGVREEGETGGTGARRETPSLPLHPHHFSHLSVDPPGPQQRRVQDVDWVGRHQHLDLVGRLKAVQLVEQLCR